LLAGTALFAVYAFWSLTRICLPPFAPPLLTVAPQTVGGVVIVDPAGPGQANRSGSRVSLQNGCACVSAARPV
jgi:hypothetical protein